MMDGTMLQAVSRIAAGLFAFITPPLLATDLYVANNGNDHNPGTKSEPLATIQSAVNRLQPGDTCLIRKGIYRETVTFPRSGTAQKPIAVKPYGSERVTVSGCDSVTGWTPYTNRI